MINELIVQTCVNWVLEESTESTYGVPAKNPLKVKSVMEESLITQGHES